MKRVLLVATMSLFALSAFGQSARIRVVHASPDAPAVDVFVNGSKVFENLPFREYTDYQPISAGTYNVQVKLTGTDTTVLQASPALSSGTDYTVIATGYANPGKNPGLDVILLTDNNALPADGGVKLRVVHAAPGAPNVDVYVTSPFETLMGKTPILSNVPWKAGSGYLEVPAANYQARVAVAGTQTIAVDSHRLVTWGNIIRTILAVDNGGGGGPFQLIILPDRN